MIRLLCNVLFLLSPSFPPVFPLGRLQKKLWPLCRRVRKPYKEGGGYLVPPCILANSNTQCFMTIVLPGTTEFLQFKMKILLYLVVTSRLVGWRCYAFITIFQPLLLPPLLHKNKRALKHIKINQIFSCFAK